MSKGSVPIDDGTLARIGSPEPGPIGLDAKGGTAKQNPASMADRIVGYASRQRGHDHRAGNFLVLSSRSALNR